jgi:hypothetical protein
MVDGEWWMVDGEQTYVSTPNSQLSPLVSHDTKNYWQVRLSIV